MSKVKSTGLQLILNFILFLFLLFSFFIINDDTIVQTETGMRLFGIAACLMIIKIFTSKRIGILGPAFILVIYTILSCFGNDILVLLLGNSMYLEVIASRHAYAAYYNLANAFYYVGCFSLLMGISYKGVSGIRKDRRPGKNEFSDYEKNLYLNIAIIIIWTYVGWLAVMLVTRQVPLTNYADLKSWIATKPIQIYLLRLTWVAMPTYMYFVSERKQIIQFSIPVLIMAAFLMLTGNRNEIMYPLAVSLGVYVWKRRNFTEKKAIPISVIIAVLLVIFVISPMISSTRKMGFGISTLLSGSYGFVSAISEMGGQINTFSVILYAIDSGIYTFQYGMTLIVPIISMLSLNLIFGTSLYNSVYNPSLVLNALNHYGRGFSYIAEAYINFGLAGIVILFWFLGRYCGVSENVPNNSKQNLFYFQIMPLFMMWSRNVFGLNFIIVIFALIINIFVQLISARKRV